MPFFLIFVLIPFTEIFVFMTVGVKIGLLNTLLLALFTAVLGGGIARHQGLETLFKAQKSMRAGSMPTKELFDGLCLVAAGALLITPGFVTDTIGFLLLIPPVRDALRVKVGEHLQTSGADMSGAYTSRGYSSHQEFHIHDPSAIEGEYEDLDKDDEKNRLQ